MTRFESERTWTQPIDRQLEVVRNLRELDREVALSSLAPAEALARAFSDHMISLDPERDLGSDAFAAWFVFQRDFLATQKFDCGDMPHHVQTLRALSPAMVDKSLSRLREVADAAEDAAWRQRQELGYYDPNP